MRFRSCLFGPQVLLSLALASCDQLKSRTPTETQQAPVDSATFGFPAKAGEKWEFYSTVAYQCRESGLNSHTVTTRFELQSVIGTGKALRAKARIINLDSMQRCGIEGDAPAYMVWTDTLAVEYTAGDSGWVTPSPEMGRLHGDDAGSGREAIVDILPHTSFLFRKFPSNRLPASCSYSGRTLPCMHEVNDSSRTINLNGYGLVEAYRRYPGAQNGTFATKLVSRNSVAFDLAGLKRVD